MNVFGYTIRAVASGVLALALVLTVGVSAQVAAAQLEESTYTFATGEVLAWSDQWQADPDSASLDEGIESIILDADVGFMLVVSMPNTLDLEEARDIVIDSFLETGDSATTIDRGAYDAVSYSLDTVTQDSVNFGVFTLFRSGTGSQPTFAYVFVSIAGQFASEFSKAQDGVTLDGGELFAGVDGQGLQDQLEAAPSNENPTTTDDETPTPEAGDLEPPTEPDPTESADGNGNGDNSGGLKGGNRTSPDDPSSSPEDRSDSGAGLVDDNTFVSPVYGTEIQWDVPLALDTERDPYVLEDSDGLDFVALLAEGDSPAFVTVTVIEADGSTPADIVELWSSADYVDSVAFSADSEVVLAESSSAIGAVARVDATESGTEVIFYSEVILDDANDALVLVEYSTAFQLFEDTFSAVQEGIAVNGDPVLVFFAPDEVAEAAGI